MQIQISKDELKKKKIFLAIPCYGGQMYGMCAKSIQDLQNLCRSFEIEMRTSYIFNESLVQRARNFLTAEFMDTDFTHFLFIDADVGFDAKDVITMLALDLPIVGGPYAKKSIKWDNIKEAIIKNPQIPAGDLDILGADVVFNMVPGVTQFNVGEPIEVLEIGTGYSMYKREVFEKFQRQYPEQAYKVDHVGTKYFGKYIFAYFDCPIDRKRNITINNPDSPRNGEVVEVGGSDRYLSEDYGFFQMVKNADIAKVFLCPWMKTTHNGTHQFQTDLVKTAQTLGHI